MIQEQIMLNVVDNSGARHIMCIRVPGDLHRRCAGAGDIIKITIKETISRGKVRRSDVLEAVVMRTKKGVRHPDGSVIRSDDDTCVLLNNNSEQPIGMRISGPATHELCSEKFMKTISLILEVFQGANHDSENPSW